MKNNHTQGRCTRILVIQTAFIGDIILTTPMLRAVKKRYPHASVDVLVTPRTAELLIGNPHIDEIMTYDKRGEARGIVNFLRVARALRRHVYEVALLPHRSWRSAFLAFCAHIPDRIGFDASPASVLYTHTVTYQRDVHETERNLHLLSPLGLNAADPTPEIHTSRDDEERAREHLKMDAADEGRIVVGVGAGSVWPTKRWLPEGFADVADRLIAERGADVILFGGPDDVDVCNRIASAMKHRPLIAAGRLSLRESAALIARCRVFVSNDTGLMHLAAAVRVPVVAIFGATVPAFGFAPYGDMHTIIEKTLPCRPCGTHGTRRCTEGTFACMREIHPGEVYEAIVTYL